MKTTKKIFAAFLAVMMIALMIPFTASAVETYKVEITGKSGYTFTLYKVASVNASTMTYSNFASTRVQTALETKVDSKEIKDTNGNKQIVTGVDVQALLSACNALSDTQLAANGVKVDDFTASYSNNNIAAGVYFVKVTGYPTGVSVKTVNNSVFALPYYNGATRMTSIEFSAGSKITDNEPTVGKSFTGKTETAISEAIGTEISYTLTGSVVGSATQPATEYKFVDTMTKGLDYAGDSKLSVKLTRTDAEGNNTERALTNAEYTVTYNAPDADSNRTLTVELDSSVLANTSDFYNYSNVVVTYKAKLNSNAVRGMKTDTIEKFTEGANAGKYDYANEKSILNNNINYVELEYTANGTHSTLVGPYLRVYTYDLVVTKVDAANNTTKLNGAKFKLYTNSACTDAYLATNGAEVETGANGAAEGTATFAGLSEGTYYLKETVAPTGYNLNTTVFEITVPGDDKTTGIVNQTVTDSLLVTPNTGGVGTMMFTIGGAALIACAGVLFLIVRKKKSAK